MEGNEKKSLCGWRRFTPACLQKFSTPFFFLVFLCLANCFQSMTTTGLLGVVMSTIERRFDLTSLQSSWISSAYDVGTIPALILCSFVGTRAHRPRWVGLSMLLMAAGSAVFVVPHFLSGHFEPDKDDITDNLCRSDRTKQDVCKIEEMTDLTNNLVFFLVARFLHSFGATPLYTMAVTMLDDSVTKEKFSLYVGMFYAFGVLGPAIGVFVGGFLLSIHTDWAYIDTTQLNYTNNDPRWVGAWWVGFIISGIMCGLLAIPFSCFPRDLPGAEEVRRVKESEAYKATDDVHAENTVDFSNMTNFHKQFKGLITNPTYVFQTLFIASQSVLLSGFAAYFPKYLETQFSLTTTMAGILFGATLLPAGAGGTILGGAIIQRFKLDCRQILRAEVILSIMVFVMIFIAYFVIQCEPIQLIGVTASYAYNNRSDMSVNLTDSCNIDCGCEYIPYSDMCSYDNVRFYSPCHAGCIGVVQEADHKEYFDCSCIRTPANTSITAGTSKLCSTQQCSPATFLICFFCVILCVFVVTSMSASASVRCIPVKHRSLGIGTQWIALRLLGTVPGPVLFGLAFDASCQFWPKKCGTNTSCMYYNTKKTALIMFLYCCILSFISLIFIILAWKLYRPPPGNTDKKTPNCENSKLTAENTNNGGYGNLRHQDSGQVSHSEIENIRRNESGSLRHCQSENLRHTENDILKLSDNGDLSHSGSGKLRHSESGKVKHSESGKLRDSGSGKLRHTDHDNKDVYSDENDNVICNTHATFETLEQTDYTKL